MPDFVRVTNSDTDKFIYHASNVRKILPPGKDVMMPWDLACSLFGDPFLTDAPKKPDRTDAIRRCRGNFNYELGMETMDHFMDRIPKLQVHDMETGQELFMLLWDAEGERLEEYVSPSAESTDAVTLLQQQVQALTTQIGLLISNRQQTPPDLVGQLPVVSTDAPGVPAPAKATEWVDGDPFAQRPDDVLTEPLFDFAAISTASPVAEDGTAIDPSNDIPEDVPQDAGVPSGRGKPTLAPKRRS